MASAKSLEEARTPAGEPAVATEIQGFDDDGAIPKGQLDPIYEAKARVLNRAVSWRSVLA